MDVGIGLPATIPEVDRASLLEWARRAEARGFSCLGTIDRIVYPNYDSLIALAAAAAVTERIRLATTILIAPYRGNGAVVAKQAATLDHLSNGRLVLGVAVGGREDDYAAAGLDFHTRGKRFGEMLELWQRIWRGDEFGAAGGIGPRPPRGRPELYIGGSVDVTFERAARYADGWIMGGAPPDQMWANAPKLEAAWRAAGREGEPRKLALAYFSLGAQAEVDAQRYLGHYYAWLGELADMIAAGAAKDAETVRRFLQGYEDAGCDELVLFPSSTDPQQVELLAEAVGL
jgi:alkanesulfonate monooxygenase SsuD/methylene tetrahydromethanopterin reductase-like flavin-dependent oxidoreductase (luciferase family)